MVWGRKQWSHELQGRANQRGASQRCSGRRWGLTESRSSMTRWGLDAEEGLVPLSLLNCVNKMFMVARSTSERLCLICTERNTWSEEKERRLGQHQEPVASVTPRPHSCQVESSPSPKRS